MTIATVNNNEVKVPGIAPDHVLWASLLAGDQFAFDGIYDRHVDAVHRVVVRRVGIQDAEDLVASVFAEMWTHRERIVLSPEGGLGPWLMGTALNLSRKFHERQASRSRLTDRVAAHGVDDEPDHAESVVAELVQADDLEVARAALATLSEEDQELLTMCILEGVPPSSVAEALGQGASTVRSRLTRARRRLGAAFHKEQTRRDRQRRLP